MRSQPRADQRLKPRCDRRRRIAHRPIDDDVLAERLENAGELLGLRAGDGLERRFVLVAIPDFLIVARFAPRPNRQDDAVEQETPQQRVVLDDALVGEKFFQVSAHRLAVRRIGRAEIDQQHANTAPGRRGFACGRGIASAVSAGAADTVGAISGTAGAAGGATDEPAASDTSLIGSAYSLARWLATATVFESHFGPIPLTVSAPRNAANRDSLALSGHRPASSLNLAAISTSCHLNNKG